MHVRDRSELTLMSRAELGGSYAPAVEQRSARSVIQRRARVAPVGYERPDRARAARVLVSFPRL